LPKTDFYGTWLIHTTFMFVTHLSMIAPNAVNKMIFLSSVKLKWTTEQVILL